MSEVDTRSSLKQKALAVFGFKQALADGEAGETSSLTYSVTPQPKENSKEASFSTADNRSSVGDTSKDESNVTNATNAAATTLDRSNYNRQQPRSTSSSHSRRPGSFGPFDKILASLSSPMTKLSGKENENGDCSSSSAPSSSSTSQQHPQRSPLRPDLVKQTQLAIDKATISVNESLNKARLAKQEAHSHRSQQTAKIKQEWQEEREAAQAFHQEAEKSRREQLLLQRQLSSTLGKNKASRQLSYREKALRQIEKESEFKSSVYREHQEKLRQLEESRRRKSIAVREKQRRDHRLGEQGLKLHRIDEDQAIFQERHEASLALRETVRANANNRRKSYCFRNGDARRIRELHTAMVNQHQQQEHSSYQLKWEGERDAEEYKQRLEQQRRESLAARGQAHRQRVEQEHLRENQQFAMEHESLELKWAGERDADAYKKQLELERRKSLALRNSQALRQRQEEAERASKELQAQKQSYELKWAGEKDAQDYLNKMEQERRDSLAFRNQDAKQQRDLEEKRRAELLAAEQQSLALKFDGERDAEAYKRKMQEKRRASLMDRNRHAFQQRNQQQMQESELKEMEHASYELKWAGEKDAEQYARDLEKQRRESLAARNQERANHASVMQELKSISREKETESLVLKWAGENDAKAYLEKLEEERRKSLQLQGKQVLHHRQVERDQREEVLQRAWEDEELRSAAQKDVEAYKEKCAAEERAFFLYRRKEAGLQRLEEEERRKEQREIESANFHLETLARSDVEEYIRGCNQRRRLSLAFRAKEKRHHMDWRLEQAEQAREARSRDVRDRLMDRRYVELARHQERAKNVMDAIRHAGCSSNPFMGVL